MTAYIASKMDVATGHDLQAAIQQEPAFLTLRFLRRHRRFPFKAKCNFCAGIARMDEALRQKPG